MATYLAFLRAINLGAVRKFPKDAIKTATELAGFTGVETYINTGNVRLETGMRSPDRISAKLEAAYLQDRGFDVPTMVMTRAEMAEMVSEIDDLWAEHGQPAQHSITLYAAPPASDAAEAAVAVALGSPDHVKVGNRWAHVLLGVNFHESRVLASKQFAALGVGTARNASVIREVTKRWC